MRYIQKNSSEPNCLAEYKKSCEENDVPKPLLYKDFNRTSALRQILIEEQHNVCCYCQRRCSAYRTEHLYPENGENKQKSKSLQLEYSNLFASCIDSLKKAPENQYCDVAKGNEIIREFIKETNCRDFFKYNSLGEIVPNGILFTWNEYLTAENLSQDENDARHAIKVLNLNHHTLVEARKSCLDSLLKLLMMKSKEDWERTISSWLNSPDFPDFIELRLQYLQKYLNVA